MKQREIFNSQTCWRNLSQINKWNLKRNLKVKKKKEESGGLQYTPFFISNTFISNARLKLAKIKQKLSNTLRLNFRYLKIFRFLYLPYPKIIEDNLQTVQKPSAPVLMKLYDWWREWRWKLKIDHKDTTLKDLALDMGTNILNIKCVSV